MKSALAVLVSFSLIGVAFGGGRAALMVGAHHPIVLMR
jgi:hypothetical protein